MRSSEPNTHTLNAKVTPELHDAVQKYAKAWGMTQQEVIIAAVQAYIGESDD